VDAAHAEINTIIFMPGTLPNTECDSVHGHIAMQVLPSGWPIITHNALLLLAAAGHNALWLLSLVQDIMTRNTIHQIRYFHPTLAP
jgi:hypothetical protein